MANHRFIDHSDLAGCGGIALIQIAAEKKRHFHNPKVVRPNKIVIYVGISSQFGASRDFNIDKKSTAVEDVVCEADSLGRTSSKYPTTSRKRKGSATAFFESGEGRRRLLSLLSLLSLRVESLLKRYGIGRSARG